MRWIILIVGVGAGCLTVGSLQHSSIENDAQANKHAQLGDGLRAARDRQLSVSEDVAARLLDESRSRYWTKEVRMY